ncbi:hypothetical protein E3N88_08897 [Mikania micrantha]|uniref:Uncharacterized protein n=1 Tax=Mikania micrantha TaxID=192012 RepID=A0A5N6PJK1_9ASTR|nr:hypothetical protein E3N88_08897 [Mikania micrantha]
MPERGAKSHLVNNGKAVQSADPHQSAWLTHWTGTRSETIENEHLARLNKNKENDVNDQDFKKHQTVIEVSSDNFVFSKDLDLITSLKKPSSRSFQFFKRGLESEKCSMLNEQVQAIGLGPQVSHGKLTGGSTVETLSSECHLQPTDQIKHHMFFSESSYLSSRPLGQVVYKLDSHTTDEPHNFRHLTAAFASKDRLPNSENTEMPSFAALLKTDPSTSNFRSLALIEEQYKKMQKHIGMGFFPHSKSETVHHGQCSSQNVVHDVEMTKMLSGFHDFSRTNHSLLLTKQTDVKLHQENQFFRESQVSNQLKEEALMELNCSPSCFDHGQEGVKLQLLDSSDPESLENVEENRASRDVQKNESSADTDAMDMESYKEDHLSGVHLFPTNKDIMGYSNLEKDKCRKRKIKLSDINLETPAQPNASSSTEKTEPCMSRTQSLDMSKLHYNLDQTANSNSNQCSNNNPGSESGSRWIKRLKLTETSSHEKINRLFTTTTEGKPERESENCHGKKSESLTGKFFQQNSEIQMGESSAVETRHECNEISLSHYWIQRWCHKQNQMIPANQDPLQPDDFESETDEFLKKQFPSIAALALMGKAMTGFPQCRLQRKESCVVWDTKISISNARGITNTVFDMGSSSVALISYYSKLAVDQL